MWMLTFAKEESKGVDQDTKAWVQQRGNFEPPKNIGKHIMSQPTSSKQEVCSGTPKHGEVRMGRAKVGGHVQYHRLGKSIEGYAPHEESKPGAEFLHCLRLDVLQQAGCPHWLPSDSGVQLNTPDQ